MALAGKSGSVYIGANKVAEITQWSVDLKADNIDVTNFDSNGWKEFIQGLKEWSGSFEGNFKPTDTNGQQALINAYMNGTTVSLELRIDTTKKIAGTVYIETIGIEAPIDDKQTFKCDFTGTGQPTLTLT